MIRLAFLLFMLSATASAQIFVDSRVLSLPQMEGLGVLVETAELPGPKDARRIWISVTIPPAGAGREFRGAGFSILEKVLDADFASTVPRKTGIRDSRKWAKEVRGEKFEKPFFRFSVSERELPYGYLVVHFGFSGKATIPDFGTYYLPFTEIRRAANQSPEPAAAQRKP